MSKKKKYAKLSTEELISIKKLVLKDLKNVNKNIDFDRRYGNENVFDSKHLKKDDLKNAIRNIDDILKTREEGGR